MDLRLSALNYVTSIKNGDFTVEEFIEKTLERIKDVDEKVHAFLQVSDTALENANKIDRRIKSNDKIGKFYGCLLYTSPSPRD